MIYRNLNVIFSIREKQTENLTFSILIPPGIGSEQLKTSNMKIYFLCASESKPVQVPSKSIKSTQIFFYEVLKDNPPYLCMKSARFGSSGIEWLNLPMDLILEWIAIRNVDEESRKKGKMMIFTFLPKITGITQKLQAATWSLFLFTSKHSKQKFSQVYDRECQIMMNSCRCDINTSTASDLME